MHRTPTPPPANDRDHVDPMWSFDNMVEVTDKDCSTAQLMENDPASNMLVIYTGNEDSQATTLAVNRTPSVCAFGGNGGDAACSFESMGRVEHSFALSTLEQGSSCNTLVVDSGDRGSSGKSLVVAAPMVVATTTGMVTMNTENVCKGHDGEWLNATQLKRLLNRDPGPLERPSVLNALAFRCSSKDCEERPCAQKLDEYNLYKLRESLQMERMNDGTDEGFFR